MSGRVMMLEAMMQRCSFKTGWRLITAACVIGFAAGLDTIPAAAAGADELVVAQLEFRGIPAREAFDQLSAALGERVVISRSVPRERLEQDIRLQVWHLAPEQAVRWIARLVDLEVIHTREGYYVATAAQLREMKIAPQGGGLVTVAVPGRETVVAGLTPALREMLERTGPVFWHDAPLTRVCADVARLFSVDLIVHPRIMAEGVLVEWEQPKATLGQVCGRLAEGFGATVSYYDGALWLDRPDGVTQTRPAGESDPHVQSPAIRASAGSDPVLPATPEVPARAGGHGVRHLATPDVESSSPPPQTPPTEPVPATRPFGVRTDIPEPDARPAHRVAESTIAPAGCLTVDESIRDWSTFARHLEAATGWTCRVHESGRAYPPMSINGPAGDVLEAMSLMGRIHYHYLNDPDRGPVIELRVRPTR